MVDIEIRPMLPDERPYVLDTFLRSYGKTRYGNGIHPDVLIGLMETLLVYWTCLVAVRQNVILGWLVYGPGPTMAWAYTRHRFRRSGIFTALINHSELDEYATNCSLEIAFEPDWTIRRFLERYSFDFNPYLPLDVARRAQDLIVNG